MAEGPGSGSLEAGIHRFPVRVYYEDTDAGGIVYHANYLRFAERGRTEFLRVLGMSHSATMAAEGLFWAVKSCAVEYVRPARLDEALEVVTEIDDIRGASLRLRQDIERNGDLLAALRLRLACMTADGRPARLPGGVQQKLAALRDARSVTPGD
jgi:acyl-CoA thioester hydrolase